MNSLAILGGAVVVSCASSFAVVKLMDSAPADAVPLAGESAQLAAVVDRQEEIQQQLTELADRLDRGGGDGSMRTSVPAVTDAQVRAAVEALLAKGELDVDALAASATEAAEGDLDKMDPQAAFLQLTEGGLSWDDAEVLWEKIRKAGLTEEVIEKYEERAAAQPGVASVQSELGNAYLQMTMSAAGDMEKGRYAIKADQAFDKALDIDSTHWEARFLKAMSLSFWPPAMGKGPEAIQHFETLVTQQESTGGGNKEFAETYLYLGNLYASRGDADKAKETWQRGYNLHPSHEALKGKVGQ